MRSLLLFTLLLLLPLSTQSETLSLSIKNAPTAEIITYLAEENGKNVVLQDEIPHTKYLRMENSNFDAVLESLAKIHHLNLKQDKGIYYINSISEQDNQKENSGLNPITAQTSTPKLLTKTIKLNYAKASEMNDSLTKGNGQILSENGYIHFDDRSNSLIIKDNAQSLKALTALIKQLDQPTEQIAIEARIVTISSEHLQALGVRWGMFSPQGKTAHFSGNIEGSGLSANNLNVNFPITNSASMLLQIASINSRVLDLELTALERENNVEIIASPRLLTTNKKSANIKQGTEIPYAVYSQKDELKSIEFREAVLGLAVTPHLSPNNQILLDLVISQNSPNSQASANHLLTIDKQEINTQVFAKHGETIVLGGIFQHLLNKGEDRVPILGSVPVIKRMFSREQESISKRELVIFVTPYIIRSEPIHTPTQQKNQKARSK